MLARTVFKSGILCNDKSACQKFPNCKYFHPLADSLSPESECKIINGRGFVGKENIRYEIRTFGVSFNGQLMTVPKEQETINFINSYKECVLIDRNNCYHKESNVRDGLFLMVAKVHK